MSLSKRGDQCSREFSFSSLGYLVSRWPSSCSRPFLLRHHSQKHDQHPQCTARGDDSESTPHYEGVGPSYAPPPFDERDAPPPFQEPSSSNATRLPTFLEAESEIYTPSQTESEKVGRSRELVIPGEGIELGFAVADQFDGHMVELEERALRLPSFGRIPSSS